MESRARAIRAKSAWANLGDYHRPACAPGSSAINNVTTSHQVASGVRRMVRHPAHLRRGKLAIAERNKRHVVLGRKTAEGLRN
jgi:hypothetical protein